MREIVMGVSVDSVKVARRAAFAWMGHLMRQRASANMAMGQSPGAHA
jgi:hypothetical protein